ncbi:Glucose/arabinose dehydrogenase, beta-propeller fold [Alteromonadaceae bacterium Bs31]|nr:Glucose/arabinose dehydrogenase, beta-propeller fold [Alteromonadaceae bacterium Bs31]
MKLYTPSLLPPQFALCLLAFANISSGANPEDAGQIYKENCSACHGAQFEGTGLGPELSTGSYIYGGTRSDIIRVVANGVISKGMPSFQNTLSEEQLNALADFIPSRHLEQTEPEESQPVPATEPSYDVAPGEVSTLDYRVKMELVAQGLETPWALAFADVDTILLTERAGGLRVIKKGKLHKKPVKGTPEVWINSHKWNQGGLLDIALHPDYAKNGWVYLCYSHPLNKPQQEQTLGMIRIVRGKVKRHAWTQQEVVFEAPLTDYNANFWHYGGRMIFDAEGFLYFSVGDRGMREQAREPGRTVGKIHRLHANGDIPKDNPFIAQQGVLQSIYSLGLRNPQGLAIHAGTGKLWASEHGPRGGDELNIIKPGADFGWPVASYGINYDGTILTPNTEFEGTEQPVIYWRPSIGVSGITFYRGNEFPFWNDKLLVTGLRYHELTLLSIHNNRVQHKETLLNFEGRPYEPVVGPDGAIYVVTDSPGQLIRISAVKQRKI